MVHQRPGVSSGGATLTVTVFQVPGDFSAVKKSLFTSSPSPKRSPSQEWTGKDLFLQFARTSFFFCFFSSWRWFHRWLTINFNWFQWVETATYSIFFSGWGTKTERYHCFKHFLKKNYPRWNLRWTPKVAIFERSYLPFSKHHCYWYFIRQQFPQLLVGLAFRWKSSFKVGDHVGLITILEKMAEAGSSYKHQFSEANCQFQGRLLFFLKWHEFITDWTLWTFPFYFAISFSLDCVQGNSGLEKSTCLYNCCVLHDETPLSNPVEQNLMILWRSTSPS